MYHENTDYEDFYQ